MNNWLHSSCPTCVCIHRTPRHLPIILLLLAPASSHSVPSLDIFSPQRFLVWFWFQFEKASCILVVLVLFRADMLTAAQRSISCTCFFLFYFIVFVLFFLSFGHSRSCVPFFVQLKQPNIFPPLAVFLFSRTWAQMSETRRRPLCHDFCIFLSLQTSFFRSSSSICFPLPVPFSKGAKKAQTTTFLIKFLRCFFPSTTYFFPSCFSWVEGCFPFWRFYFFHSSGLGKS